MTVSNGSFAIGVTNDFDLDQIKKNQKLGQAAGYVGMRMAGDIAEYEQRQAINDLIEAKGKNDKAAEADAKARLANWGSGGRNKVILHGMIGAATAALGGGNVVQGALGATASEAASGVMQTYLNNHGIKPNSTTGNTLMNLASSAIGAAASDGNGAATALYGDKYNRQLHSEEIDWINTHAKAFARQQCNGCDPSTQQVHEAKAELTQQALRDVDLLWHIHIPEGDNSKQAQHFLETAQGSFTNAIGEQQQLFITEGSQYTSPLTQGFATPKRESFYERYAQPGATRGFADGSQAVISQALTTIGHNLSDTGWWANNAQAASSSVLNGINYLTQSSSSEKIEDATKLVAHGFTDPGRSIGQAAASWNDTVTEQLNTLYGRDITGEQRALQGANAAFDTLGLMGSGKVLKEGGSYLLKRIDVEGPRKAALYGCIAISAACPGLHTGKPGKVVEDRGLKDKIERGIKEFQKDRYKEVIETTRTGE